MRFQATILLSGKTATGIRVPPDAGARRAFEALSYGAQQRVVMQIETVRTAGTRQRRVAKAVSELREGA